MYDDVPPPPQNVLYPSDSDGNDEDVPSVHGLAVDQCIKEDRSSITADGSEKVLEEAVSSSSRGVGPSGGRRPRGTRVGDLQERNGRGEIRRGVSEDTVMTRTGVDVNDRSLTSDGHGKRAKHRSQTSYAWTWSAMSVGMRCMRQGVSQSVGLSPKGK